LLDLLSSLPPLPIKLLLGTGFLYAVLSLDHISAGHFMLSRPIVVGPLLGWYLGDARLGLACGIAVELLWVHVIPVGIWSVDTTSMAGLATVWAIFSGRPWYPALLVGLLWALPAGILVRHVDILLRRRNEMFILWVEEGMAAGKEDSLMQAVTMGICFWFLKAWIFFMLLGGVGQYLVNESLSLCSPRMMTALDFTARLLPLLGLGSAMNYFFNRGKSTLWNMRTPS
jgi:mannose/fructose/N-acetylgalactosamine-specific phosphotransferase system component IIC